MRLLLDEMYGPTLAALLRSRGYDVEALTERPEQRSKPDHAVLQIAADDGKVLVTEDVRDFARLDGRLRAEGQAHHGIILVSARRYPRSKNGVGRLAEALDDFLASPPSGLSESFLWWLA